LSAQVCDPPALTMGVTVCGAATSPCRRVGTSNLGAAGPGSHPDSASKATTRAAADRATAVRRDWERSREELMGVDLHFFTSREVRVVRRLTIRWTRVALFSGARR